MHLAIDNQVMYCCMIVLNDSKHSLTARHQSREHSFSASQTNAGVGLHCSSQH